MHIDGNPGSVGQINMINEKTSRDAASIQYNSDDETFYFAVMNKNTGTWRTLLDIKNDGTASIGNGMVQHQIATLEDINGLSDFFDVINRSSVDLDTLKTKGRYAVAGANLPPHTTSGIMEVSIDEASGHIIQAVATTGNYTSYTRAFDGAVWSEWHQDGVPHVIGLMMNMIIGKASKSSLPTIYSGDTVPLPSLGKDLDWYHHYEQGSAVSNILYSSTSREGYHPVLFALAADYQGDVPQNEISSIEITPSNGMVYIDLSRNATLPIEELTLEITNHGDAPVDIPIVVYSNAAGEFMGTYSNTYNPVMEKITGINSNTANMSTFKLKVKEGVQTDKEYDYQKHNGEWYRTDFLNVDQVNALIREYSVTVSMDTNQNKPTEVECIAAFIQLPHYDYTKDDGFFIMSLNLYLMRVAGLYPLNR